MFHIKFCTKCHWNFGGFLKIHIAFYKHTSKIIYRNNMQQNYLSIKSLLHLLAAFVVEKTRFLSIFFSNSEFWMRVYKGKLGGKSEGIPLHTFLRISPRKIYVLKKTKLGSRELNEVNCMNVKKMPLNLMNVLKSTTKMSKKMKLKKKCPEFFYTWTCYRAS